MRSICALMAATLALSVVLVEEVALLGAAARVADHAGRPAGQRERPVAGVLEAAQDQQTDEVADVEAVGGGVAAVVERDRSLGQPGGQRGRGRCSPARGHGPRGRRGGPRSPVHSRTARGSCKRTVESGTLARWRMPRRATPARVDRSRAVLAADRHGRARAHPLLDLDPSGAPSKQNPDRLSDRAWVARADATLRRRAAPDRPPCRRPRPPGPRRPGRGRRRRPTTTSRRCSTSSRPTDPTTPATASSSDGGWPTGGATSPTAATTRAALRTDPKRPPVRGREVQRLDRRP